MTKSFQNKEKRHWAIEKLKLRNARKLRGPYSSDRDDMEFKHTLKKRAQDVRYRRNLLCHVSRSASSEDREICCKTKSDKAETTMLLCR